MSRRGIIPIAMVVGFGIMNGYVTFNPAFQDRELEKMKAQEALDAANLGPNMIEIPIGVKASSTGDSGPMDAPSSSGFPDR